MPDHLIAPLRVTRVAGGAFTPAEDLVAVEHPLEIRIGGRAVTATLRSPGHDEELATGFLAGEKMIARAADVASIRATPAECADQPDVIELELVPAVRIDWTRLERHFAATAACGLCGRAHVESLRAGLERIEPAAALPVSGLLALSERLRKAQAGFAATGGLHGAAWCDESFEPRVLREDVGRHNAVDKVAGWLLAQGRYPVSAGLLWVSGRAGAEIVLKAARARLPALAAVGAPSSLAVELAEAAGMTLVGFLREGRMNIYCGAERVRAG